MRTKRALAPYLVLVPVLACFTPVSAYAQTGETIFQKSRDTYAQLQSYADTGEIIAEYGATDRHAFTTYFNRTPRHFLLDFHQQAGDRYVIWADGDAFHTWWKATGQVFDYPNPNNTPAISLSGPSTKSAAIKIPALLYSKADLGGDFTHFAGAALNGTDDVAGHRCYRLTGHASDTYAATGNEVNIRAMTIWIDTESLLIRQVREEWKPVGGIPHRVTTTYQPQGNVAIEAAKFKFVPPAQ